MSATRQMPPVSRTGVGLHDILRRPRVSGAGLVMIPLFIALLVADVALQPSILEKAQIALTIQTILPLVMISIAQCIVLLTGGIDVSVGGTMVVANVLIAKWPGAGTAQYLHVLLILGSGVLLGGINGFLVVVGGFEPFVATLGTWAIYDGIALLVLPTAGGQPPLVLSSWAQNISGLVPWPVILLVIILLFWWYWKGTRLCKAIYSVGSDENRAALSGVRVGRTKFIAYVLAGLCAAVAGVYLGLITATGDPTVGDGYILNSVEACVLGGVSLAGGEGGIGLAVAGAFILTFINGIASVLNLPPWVAIVFSAALLLAVIGVRSRFVRGRAE